MNNLYKGEVKVTIKGGDYFLVFDWDALSILHTEFRDHLNEQGMLDCSKLTELKDIARLASVGMVKNHPDMTVEKIIALSPPVVALRGHIDHALAYSYFGPELFEKVKEAVDGKPDEAPVTKKKPWTERLATLLRSPFKRH